MFTSMKSLQTQNVKTLTDGYNEKNILVIKIK